MRRGARSRTREARKAVQTAGAALFQSPGRSLDNPHPPLAPLTDDAAFIVVDRIGVEENLEEFYFDTPYLIVE